QSSTSLGQRSSGREQDLPRSVVRVIKRELGRGRVVSHHITGVDRVIEVALYNRSYLVAVLVVVGRVRQRQRLGARNCVVTRPAMDRVIAPAAVDDVVGVKRAEENVRRSAVRIEVVWSQ